MCHLPADRLTAEVLLDKTDNILLSANSFDALDQALATAAL